MPESARQIALDILNQLWRSHDVLDRILETRLEEAQWLSRQDRALVSALVFGVVRWRAHLDWIIQHFSRTPLRKIELQVMNILRLGLFQVIFLDRIPASAAVNTAVELAKEFGSDSSGRFVNSLA